MNAVVYAAMVGCQAGAMAAFGLPGAHELLAASTMMLSLPFWS